MCPKDLVLRDESPRRDIFEVAVASCLQRVGLSLSCITSKCSVEPLSLRNVAKNCCVL